MFWRVFVVFSTFFSSALWSNQCQEALSAACQQRNFKHAIEIQKEFIEKAEDKERSRLKVDLAVLYLKDQDQESAFQIFLEALETVKTDQTTPMTQETEDLYKSALALYLEHGARTPQATAELICKEYGICQKKTVDAYLLGYVVALAYANLGNYEDFFNVFFDAYRHYPDHFLAFKTKAVLHIKLFDRARSETDRQRHREAISFNINQAIDREPRDDTLYKMLITFSSQQNKQEHVRRSLNKIIHDNIIIPRCDIQFYVQEAVEMKDYKLTQQFIDRAGEWYKNSRLVNIAQKYLDTHTKTDR